MPPDLLAAPAIAALALRPWTAATEAGNGVPPTARKRVLPQENEERLSALGRQVPPPSEDELEIVAGLRSSRRRRRLLTWGTALIVVALGAGAIRHGSVRSLRPR